MAVALKLTELLTGLEGARVSGELQEIAEVRDDSRLVGPGDLFVAVSGTTADGRKFLADAIARHAVAVVVEQTKGDGEPGVLGAAVPAGFRGAVVTVPNARHALAVIAANRFAGAGAGAGALTLTAVTGTNGKTTTTYLMEAMLGAAGIRTGVIGTVAYRVGGGGASGADAGEGPVWSRPAPLTTPGALALHGLFADMRGAGATDVVLEASSHALEQSRLDGCCFRVAGLTNLTLDHLDYHGSMARYFDAKAILFERLLDPKKGVAVLPVDLPEGRAMRARVVNRGGPAVLGVAVTRRTPDADVVVESVAMSAAGIRVALATPNGPLTIESPLVGGFNLSNIVLAVGMAIARGIGSRAIVAGLARLRGVPGRLERVPNDAGVLCVVDYAHTPDALERALAAVRPLMPAEARLITVFGCGGDRDRSKRPLMGRAAAAGSDLAIVTSDNPRSEDANAIIAEIVAGMNQPRIPRLDSPADLAAWTRASSSASAGSGGGAYHVAADRRVAIRSAVAAARAQDVVLIAGKGHEDYQIIGATRIHFDDREEAAAAFVAKAAVEPEGILA